MYSNVKNVKILRRPYPIFFILSSIYCSPKCFFLQIQTYFCTEINFAIIWHNLCLLLCCTFLMDSAGRGGGGGGGNGCCLYHTRRGGGVTLLLCLKTWKEKWSAEKQKNIEVLYEVKVTFSSQRTRSLPIYVIFYGSGSNFFFCWIRIPKSIKVLLVFREVKKLQNTDVI